MLVVDAGVDYQTDGAPDVGLEAAVVGVGVLVEAYVFAEMLGIECPALDEGRVLVIFSEGGNVCLFLGDGELEMVAGKAFVVGDGLDGIEVAVGWLVGIDKRRPGRLPSPVPSS